MSQSVGDINVKMGADIAEFTTAMKTVDMKFDRMLAAQKEAAQAQKALASTFGSSMAGINQALELAKKAGEALGRAMEITNDLRPQGAREYREAVASLDDSVMDLVASVGAELRPALVEAAKVAKGFVDALRGFNFKQLIADIAEFGSGWLSGIQSVVTKVWDLFAGLRSKLGEWASELGGMLAEPFKVWVGGVVESLKSILGAMGKVSGKLGFTDMKLMADQAVDDLEGFADRLSQTSGSKVMGFLGDTFKDAVGSAFDAAAQRYVTVAGKAAHKLSDEQKALRAQLDVDALDRANKLRQAVEAERKLFAQRERLAAGEVSPQEQLRILEKQAQVARDQLEANKLALKAADLHAKAAEEAIVAPGGNLKAETAAYAKAKKQFDDLSGRAPQLAGDAAAAEAALASYSMQRRKADAEDLERVQRDEIAARDEEAQRLRDLARGFESDLRIELQSVASELSRFATVFQESSNLIETLNGVMGSRKFQDNLVATGFGSATKLVSNSAVGDLFSSGFGGAQAGMAAGPGGAAVGAAAGVLTDLITQSRQWKEVNEKLAGSIQSVANLVGGAVEPFMQLATVLADVAPALEGFSPVVGEVTKLAMMGSPIGQVANTLIQLGAVVGPVIAAARPLVAMFDPVRDSFDHIRGALDIGGAALRQLDTELRSRFGATILNAAATFEQLVKPLEQLATAVTGPIRQVVTELNVAFGDDLKRAFETMFKAARDVAVFMASGAKWIEEVIAQVAIKLGDTISDVGRALGIGFLDDAGKATHRMGDAFTVAAYEAGVVANAMGELQWTTFQAADANKDAADKAKELAESLTNVPSAYYVARVRDAVLSGQGLGGGPESYGTTQEERDADDRARDEAAGYGDRFVITGPVTVVANDPEEFLRKLQDRQVRESVRRYGRGSLAPGSYSGGVG